MHALGNPLSDLLDAPHTPVSVSFKASITPAAGQSVSPGPAVAVDKTATSGAFDLVADTVRSILLRPEPELLGAGGEVEWGISVTATVSGLPGCSGPVAVDVAVDLPVRQLNLGVPAVVFGFSGRNYTESGGRSVLTWLCPSMTADIGGSQVSGLLVDNDSGGSAVSAIRSAVGDVLSALRLTLFLLSPFGTGGLFPDPDDLLPPPPGGPAPTPFQQALLTLAGAGTDHLTFDGYTERDELLQNDDPDWNNDIWSVMMISPPNGPRLALFDDEKCKGTQLTLQMPPGHLIGGYSTLWSMSRSSGSRRSPPAEPPPPRPQP